MADDMIVLSRVFDLLAWLVPKSEGFPRAYRSTVTRRLVDAALDVQERLFDAQSRGAAGAGSRPCTPPMPRSHACACTCASPTTGTG